MRVTINLDANVLKALSAFERQFIARSDLIREAVDDWLKKQPVEKLGAMPGFHHLMPDRAPGIASIGTVPTSVVQICPSCRASDCALCWKVKLNKLNGLEIFRCQCQVCGGAVPVAVVESVALVGSAE